MEMPLEEMLLFRTRNGSIPDFIYGTPKWFYIEPFFFVVKKVLLVLFGKMFYVEPRGTLF